MTCSSFAEVKAADLIEDLAVTLSGESAGTLTEFSFAERGTSKFNKAIYLERVDSQFLEGLLARDCNISFLADCEKGSINVQQETLVVRKATNSSIQRKRVISFDIDFKDMTPPPSGVTDRFEFAALAADKLIERTHLYGIPLWIINFSGNGLHLHFKLGEAYQPRSPQDYKQQYIQWIDLFSLILSSGLVFDRSCSNIARLMRLPLSVNWKDSKRPVKTVALFHNATADASNFFGRINSPPTLKTTQKHAEKLGLEAILRHFGYRKFDSFKYIGDQVVGSSPFSSDDTPSFYYHPLKKVFYDFSTGKGGNLIQLVAELSGERSPQSIERGVQKILVPSEVGEVRGKSLEDGNYVLRDDGVWYSQPVGESNEGQWICSPLTIKAMTRDRSSGAWGRILAFYDQDNVYKTWAMPMDLLAGDGLELRKELLGRGLRISSSRKARRHLIEYIQSTASTGRVRCIDRIGWQADVFVLPTKVFQAADSAEDVVLQKEGDFATFQARGTLAEWQENVARLCLGNSKLLFVLAAAFAPPLLNLVGEESGGVHLVGPSSIGKTMALRVAGSVWGGGGVSGFVRKWRSTVNGLESLAESRCDSLLLLDEMAEISAKDAAQATYMLANGCGKKRLDRNGIARPSAEWRILFLSSGEVGLGSHLADAGENHRGGQFVRLVELDADAGKGLGIFDCKGEYDDPRLLADELQRSSKLFYGTAIEAFLAKLVALPERERVVDEMIRSWLGSGVAAGLPGQLVRVAKRFAIISAGGELAARMGILPVEEDEVKKAVQECFRGWVCLHQDHPDFETTKILAQIRQYLQANGCSQFPEWDGKSTGSFSGKCAGYRLITKDGEVEWLVLNEVFRSDVCRGVDFRRATQVLKSLDLIKLDRSGKSSIPLRLPHFGLTRVYHLRSTILDGEGAA